jgi:hypothetical protein
MCRRLRTHLSLVECLKGITARIPPKIEQYKLWRELRKLQQASEAGRNAN